MQSDPPSDPPSPGFYLSAKDLRRADRGNMTSWKAIEHALNTDSPRAAALLAVAHLDMWLEDDIHSKFVAYARAKDERLFGPGAPLSSTEAKVHLCYSMGMFGDITRDDLIKICNIRNIFAHSPFPATFEFQTIKNLCFELKAIKTYEDRKIYRIANLGSDYTNPRKMFVNYSIGIPMMIWMVSKFKDGQVVIMSMDLREPPLP